MSSSYLELRTLLPGSRGKDAVVIGSLHPSSAAAAAARHGMDEPCSGHDRVLLAACRQEDDPGAFLCLRCHISHPLEQKVSGIHRQFGSHYGLDLITMASYALDDDGRERSYAQLISQPTAAILPFTAQVICSYDPQRGAGLPHWARIKLQDHNGLKAYLREHGLLVISPWALLADTSPRRIRESLTFFGVGGLTSARAVSLHAAYCNHYAKAKEEHRRRTGRRSCWVPSDAFLLSIAPDQLPDTTREELLAMDAAIRRLLTQHWHQSLQQQEAGGAALEVPDPSTLHGAIDDDEGDEGDASEKLALVHAALDRALSAVMPTVLAPAVSDSQLRCLWQGYGEGLTNTPLAERCGCSRGTVSKKLRPEQHATTIATAAALELRRHPAFAAVAGSVEGAERLVEALRNHLLHPEREGDIAPLRRWVHQHLPVS